MNDHPSWTEPIESEPDEQDPRITAAVAELIAEAQATGLDPTPVLSDARFRALVTALVTAGVLDDETAVRLEVDAIEETTAQIRQARAALEAEERRRRLLEPLNAHREHKRRHGG